VRLRIVDVDAPTPTPSASFGLVSMSERAHAIGAAFRVESRPAGTTVEVKLP
jgi:signal transduction histidine kinase